MQTVLSIEDMLELRKEFPLIDVRTPAEFEHAHIPGAHNIPLFTNQQRAEVGTIYKQAGKQNAVMRGLDFVGSELRNYVEAAQKIARNNRVILHCWRGGMRSGSMAWLYQTAGLQADILEGGYKSYRRLAQQYFENNWKLMVIGGYTGAGKTDLLKEMRKIGLQVVDLEDLAHHKGSAFGHLYQPTQPSSEQFENDLFEKLLKMDSSKTIWLEDESQSIGSVWIPQSFFMQMRVSDVIRIDVDFEVRVQRLANEYAGSSKAQKEHLVQAVTKIRKRLGGLRAQEAIAAIDEANYVDAVRLILPYYDKTYQFGLDKRSENHQHPIEFNGNDYSKLAKQIAEKYA